MVDSQNRGITFVDDDGTIAIVCFEKDDDDSVLEQIEELSDVLKDEFEYKPRITVGSAVQGFEIWQFPTMMPDIFWNMKKEYSGHYTDDGGSEQEENLLGNICRTAKYHDFQYRNSRLCTKGI